MTTRLYAKSHRNGEPASSSLFLPGHLEDVHSAAERILQFTLRDQLEVLGLDTDLQAERLRRIVLLAAALHDLGKANDQFQAMLINGTRQALRHEWVTLLIIGEKTWKDWLLPAVDGDVTDWQIVRWSISGHHPRYDRSAPPELNVGGLRMRILMANKDMDQAVQWLKDTFPLEGFPELRDREIDLSVKGSGELDELHRAFYDAEDAYDDLSIENRRLCSAAKNCLIAADVAGSALPRDIPDEEDRADWIGKVLRKENLPNQSAFREVLATRFKCQPAEVPNKLRDFQEQAGENHTIPGDQFSPVLFIRAGCGTGKTVGAIRYAETHCQGRRLYICYPTTGTATEGFRDYLMDPELSEHVKTNLQHGRRRADFELLQAEEDRNTQIARIESLDLWRIPVVACTVDTVLGLVQNNRRGLFSWPALSQGGFVFDEIHSYDDKLFDALLHFLAVMVGAPSLLMTASLSSNRLTAIREVLHKSRRRLVEIPGPKNLEDRPRYTRELLGPKEKTSDRIRKEWESGGKILRICNTVGAAMREADQLREAGLEPILYHSRFRYLDRVRQHQAVIEAFQSPSEPSLVVCTQVAEMSLDLSATLLITDLAPVPSIIQRLGRLNRRAEEGEPARPFIVVDPMDRRGKYSPLPYDTDDLSAASEWLEHLWLSRFPRAIQAHACEWLTKLGAEVLHRIRNAMAEGGCTAVAEIKAELEDAWLSALPEKQLKKGRAWLDNLTGEDTNQLSKWLPSFEAPYVLSQSDLATQWEMAQDSSLPVPRYQSAWLDYGPATPVLELREGSPTITIVMEEDWEALKNGKTTLAEVAIPLPIPPATINGKSFEWESGAHNGVPVAKKGAVTYCPKRGAEWAK